jgi:hypothetical protein
VLFTAEADSYNSRGRQSLNNSWIITHNHISAVVNHLNKKKRQSLLFIMHILSDLKASAVTSLRWKEGLIIRIMSNVV